MLLLPMPFRQNSRFFEACPPGFSLEYVTDIAKTAGFAPGRFLSANSNGLRPNCQKLTASTQHDWACRALPAAATGCLIVLHSYFCKLV